MNIINNKWLNNIQLIKVFLAGCIAFLICHEIVSKMYKRGVEASSFIRHRIIVKKLEEYVKTNNTLPQNLSDLELGNDASLITYYPEAWRHSGKILLINHGANDYIVTFGDTSRAVLISYDAVKESKTDFKIRPYIFDIETVIILVLLLLSFLISKLIEVFLKKNIKGSVHLTV